MRASPQPKSTPIRIFREWRIHTENSIHVHNQPDCAPLWRMETKRRIQMNCKTFLCCMAAGAAALMTTGECSAFEREEPEKYWNFAELS